MKKTLLFLSFILALSCRQNAREAAATPEAPKAPTQESTLFDWLTGAWQRTNEEAGKATYEFWQKINPKEYRGFGFTLMDRDTIWQERMWLQEGSKGWELKVKAPEDPEPVVFVLTGLEGGSFTCENPETEFPKKIRYWTVDDKLKASVSNNELEIPFEFERLKE